MSNKPPIGVNRFRKGHMIVDREAFLSDAEAARELMSRIVVVKCDHNACTDELEYWAYSDEFDMVENGSLPPEYRAVFTRDVDNALSMQFMRVDVRPTSAEFIWKTKP